MLKLNILCTVLNLSKHLLFVHILFTDQSVVFNQNINYLPLLMPECVRVQLLVQFALLNWVAGAYCYNGDQLNGPTARKYKSKPVL